LPQYSKVEDLDGGSRPKDITPLIFKLRRKALSE
jgi:hypothetical protein